MEPLGIYGALRGPWRLHYSKLYRLETGWRRCELWVEVAPEEMNGPSCIGPAPLPSYLNAIATNSWYAPPEKSPLSRYHTIFHVCCRVVPYLPYEHLLGSSGKKCINKFLRYDTMLPLTGERRLGALSATGISCSIFFAGCR